mgnify:CR=1 FL=1
MSLYAIVDAHEKGFDENMYLDSATRTKVEETGGANFLFVTKDNTVVTPKSPTILPSITRRSLLYVAEHYLGLKTEEREVYMDEVKILQSAVCAVQQQSSLRLERSWITTRRSASPAVWRRWAPRSRSCTIH